MPRVFLSPSTQEWNKYATEGNEEQYMNLLADKMEPYLIASGITFTRNDPSRNVTGAIEDSNNGWYDVHLALHSNAGGAQYAGISRGIEIYYSPYSEYSRRLATIMANNLEMIYPIPGKVMAVPTTTLAEVTRTKAVSVLAELGYHDNFEDEAWLKENLDGIARIIVQSLCDYFGIPFIEPSPIRKGQVRTDGTNLNIRSYPSTESSISGKLPNGASVSIYGETGKWYVVGYEGVTGYASSDYISII